jgi:hypothetical protein
VDPNEQQLELLKQIVKWTREAALPAVEKRVFPLLDTDTKKRVYQAIAEGTVTVRKLEDVAKVGRDTAQKFVTEWEEAGMVEPGSNPPKAIFTLAELGISPPGSKGPATKKSAKA